MAIPISASQVKFSGDYEAYARLTAGAYVCKVVAAQVVPEKSYLLLMLDPIEGEFAGIGTKQFESTGKNYGFIKVYKSYKDNGKGEGKSPIWFFYQMLARFEEENPGKYKQTDLDEKHLLGLHIGVVLRDEEYEDKDGEIQTSPKFCNFAEISRIREGKVKIPAVKKLRKEEEPLVSANSVMPDDERIPF